MNRPLPPFPRPIPADQVHVGYVRPTPGQGELAPRPTLVESYRLGNLRVWSDAGQAVDLLPRVETEPNLPMTEPSPSTAELVEAPSRPTAEPVEAPIHLVFPANTLSPCSDAEAEAHQWLRTVVENRGVDWTRAARWSPSLDWAQPGVAIRGLDEDAMLLLAVELGLDVWLRWDDFGVRVRSGDETLAWLPAARVSLREVRPGCPLRSGVDDFCTPWGGPWTGQSRAAWVMWQRHRRMLVTALGCGVCHGGEVHQRSIG